MFFSHKFVIALTITFYMNKYSSGVEHGQYLQTMKWSMQYVPSAIYQDGYAYKDIHVTNMWT